MEKYLKYKLKYLQFKGGDYIIKYWRRDTK